MTDQPDQIDMMEPEELRTEFRQVLLRTFKLEEQLKLLTFEPVLEKLQAQNEALQGQVKEYEKLLDAIEHYIEDDIELQENMSNDPARIKKMGEK